MAGAIPFESLAPARQSDLLAALAAVETAEKPVIEAAFRALQDPSLRGTLRECLKQAGRVLLKAEGGWLSGYDDTIRGRLATEGVGVLSPSDRAVLTLVLIHSVAIPRAKGQISSGSWLHAEPVSRETLDTSKLTSRAIDAGLRRLHDAGILRNGPTRAQHQPSHQFLRLTEQTSQRVWENLMILAQPGSVMAEAIRRGRAQDQLPDAGYSAERSHLKSETGSPT